MYQSAEAHHGPSQASNSNLFARIVNVFKLTSSSHQRFSVGKVFLKSSQNSQENTFARVSF